MLDIHINRAIVLLGAPGIDKTSIANTFCNNHTYKYTPSIYNILQTAFTWRELVGFNKHYNIVVIDLPGQTDYSTINPEFLDINYIYIVVFSKYNYRSLETACNIIKNLKCYLDIKSVNFALLCSINNTGNTEKLIDDSFIEKSLSELNCKHYRQIFISDSNKIKSSIKDIIVRIDNNIDSNSNINFPEKNLARRRSQTTSCITM